jgi:transmembrane protein DUF3566
MTNRARPTWPEGAADNSKTQRPSQGGSASTPPATPTSNGRSTGGNGQQRSGDFRPQPRPGSVAAPGAGQSGTPQSRPPQQPPARPGTQPGARPASPVSPGQVTPSPSTPGRPEAWAPGAGSPDPDGQSSYGLTGKAGALGDRVSAARQAVLDKANAVKDAAKPDKATKAETKFAAKAEKPPKPSKAPKATTRPQTRKARLRMSRIDPWSVMKTAFLLSIAFGIVTWVAVFIVWSAIGAAGVFDNINNTVTEVLGTPAAEPFRIENYINTGKVMGFTTLLACADVLIITALATLGSFLYNIAATLLGGLEVTLASED